MATSKIHYGGKEYPTVPVNFGGGEGIGATFGEITHAERLLKKSVDDWSQADQTRVCLWLSIRRVDHRVLPWEAMDQLPADAFEIVPDPHPYEPSDEHPGLCDACGKRPDRPWHTEGEADPTNPPADPQEA